MKWADKLVHDFNEHRRQGELPRTLISVEVVTGEGEVRPATGHDWQETLRYGRRGRTYKCANCGITGQRKGKDWPPFPDKEFKGRWFASCDKAREYMPLNTHERIVYR